MRETHKVPSTACGLDEKQGRNMGGNRRRSEVQKNEDQLDVNNSARRKGGIFCSKKERIDEYQKRKRVNGERRED